ncbi:D-alanyl-D-alanine carboxypeptidase/D-alanyl-D-alanine-endopeptidase [Candidatus Moduliflexus flocculans]|uniref:D-alanyl-D-alanine carboxypeptidase/D-alanyl-D-alanine-endopeptidase n=1 Tax=Candidatus Moduliflexus flocculans TaxID=1499966 RepID=A0A081BS60_9BACT|nr:D-alanyl-D-alanine carboxypeptidase/D-alanyl-D-alanine-endopeptidase [Candidatus Moduliflexus flocculans]
MKRFSGSLSVCCRKTRRSIRLFCHVSLLGSLVVLLFLFPKGLNADNTSSLRQLQNKIDNLLRSSALKNAAVGVQIVSLNTGEVVYERNPDLGLNPASNTKLITSATALVRLSPEYRYQTRVYADGGIRDGVLQGNVYLKGSGDPTFAYEGLLRLAQDVYNLGIRSISGDVIGDDTFFDDEREFSGWHDFKQAYSSKISALSLNKNSVTLRIKPAYRSGLAPLVILEPPTSYIAIKNKAVTLGSNQVYASFLPAEESAQEETLIVQGKVSAKSSYGVSATVHVNNPSLFATTSFKNALEQIGMTVRGKVALAAVPKKSSLLATYESAPLPSIIAEANKASDNFVAEQLMKTLGAEEFGAPGTTQKGIQAVQAFLAELDIPQDAYVLENGSGLSRNNRVTPQQLVTLLRYMYDDFAVRAEYLASLAIAGVDGTLQRRMRDAERRLRAKTGAINSVSCLSGYAASQDNEIFAFSIMMNGYKSGGYEVKKVQNQIGLLLTEFYRPEYNADAEPHDSPSTSSAN